MTTNSNHFKRFIFDLDDTVSFTHNRDWENATADDEMIEKINQLYDEGFEIWFCTARGMLSCGGDIRIREEVYRESIVKWLRDHNVKYHMLSFEKVLGAYYVDDKALSIEDFKKKKFRIFRGLSGTDVFVTDDKIVSKTCDNALAIAAWHEKATDYQYNVPEVHSVIGKTINLEFIHGKPYKPDTIIRNICNIAHSFSDYKPLYNWDFSYYINRIEEHLHISELSKQNQKYISKQLNDIEQLMDDNKSFCHGDYSIDNLIITNNSIYLIDPNPTEYSSWLLDISKLLMSLERFGYLEDYNNILDWMFYKFEQDIYCGVKDILRISHWIRILKYIRNKPEHTNLYQLALNTINQYCEKK